LLALLAAAGGSLVFVSASGAAIPSAFLTVVDQNGANDVPGQQDLTQMGRDDSDPSVYRIFWSWDDTADWTSSGNTGVACALFDTNGDGRTDYEVCGEIFNPTATTVTQTASSPAPYSCTPANVNAVDRCQNPVAQTFTSSDIQSGVLTTPPAAPGASPPGNLITNTDPFPTGGNAPNDSTLEIVIRKGFLPTEAVLTNVCSHTSIAGGANNNPADCIAPAGSGLLVIKKDAGTDASTPFVFTPTPNPNPSPTYSVTGSGQSNPISLLIGTNTESVSEAVPAGWALTGGSCKLASGTSSGAFDNANNRISGITIQSGLVTTCTFTDVNKPSLTVSKDNDANHDSTFTDNETVPGNATYPYTVTYQVTIRNGAASPATITAISDTKVAAPLRSASSTDTDCADVIGTTIAAGATVVCRYDATFADAAQAQVVNTVSVTATNAAGNDTKTDTSTVNFTQTRALSLTKSALPTTYSQPGQTINYTYVVKNTGNVPLAGPVTVTDDKAAVTCSSDRSLGVNESMTCTASYAVSQADIDARSVVNHATAHANGTNSNQATATVNAVASSGLSLIKSATPATYNAVGQMISYSYLVKNTGNVTLAGPVTVTDDKAAVTCPPGGLAPGATTTCTATYPITQADLDAGFVTNHATAHANGIDSNEDSRTVTAVQRRSLSLVKSTPPTTYRDVSNQIMYSYLVTNTGNVTLKGPVTVSDDRVAVSCSPGDLAPGAATTCTATYSIVQSDLDTGAVVNHATAHADGVDSNPDSQTVTLVRSPGLSLAKAAGTDFHTPPVAGDTIHYSFTIENTGNVTLTGLNLTDALVGYTNQVCRATTLAPQASASCTADYTLTQADVDAGGRANSATACGTPPPGATPSPTCDSKSTATPIAGSPAMTLAKSSTTSTITAAGQAAPYLYFVTNTGNVTLHNVNVTDDRVTTVSCPQSTLAPGASETCTGTHVVTQAEMDAGGNLVNHATAHSTEAPDATAQLSIPMVQSPALTLAKSASPETYDHVGELITYTYTVTNTGNVTLAGPLTVNDDKLLTASCPSTATLAPGASIVCTVSHAIVQADLDAGSITNTASATIGVITSPPDSATVTATLTPILTVTKSSATTSLSAPQLVAYSYVVTNLGNVTLTGISLVDDNAANMSCPGTSLAPGAFMTCTASHVLTQAELDANGSPTAGSRVLRNTVTAHSDQAPDASKSLDIPIVRNAVLTVKKSSTTSVLSAPQTVQYSYLVTNTGNVDLTGISLIDDNATNMSCPGTSLAPGAFMTCTASHAFTQAELDAKGSPTPGSGVLHDDVTAHSDQAPDAHDSLDIPISGNPAMTVSKSSSTSSLSAPQTITYDYTVKNIGTVTLTGINLVDDNAGTVTCPATTLAVGTSMICHATHLFTQTELDANGSPTGGSRVLHNTVTAHSTQTPNAHDTLDIPIVRNAALTVAKSSSTASLSTPQTVGYDYLVKNTGNVTLTGIGLVDDNAGTVTCPATSLDPGASMTCHATHLFTQTGLDADGSPTTGSGLLHNTVTAHSTEAADARASLDIPISASPAMTVKKSSVTSSLSAPQTVTYDYLVTNTGNLTLTGITLADDNAGTVTCPTTTLAVGASTTCRATRSFTQAELDANGSPTAGSGSLQNTVTAHSDQTPDVQDSLSVPIVQSPVLTVAKSSLTSNLSAPQTVQYSYLVTNTGNVTLTGISLVDDNAGNMSCPGVSLAPGLSMTCTASRTFTQTELDADGSPTADSGVLANTVTATSSQAPDAHDSLGIPIVQNAALTVAKSSPTASLSAPATVGYDYLVTNTGNVDLTGIGLVDDNAAVDPSCPTTLAVGASMTCHATHEFTQAELDANGSPTSGSGVLHNTVTAHSNEAPPATDSLAIPIVRDPRMTVAKSSATASLSAAPQTVSYDYLVTNSGDVDLTGIGLVDDNAGTVSCPAATLAVGGSMTCTASHLFTQSELDANGSPDGGGGLLANIVTAHSAEAPDARDSLEIPIVRDAALTVRKSSLSSSLSAPQTVTYNYLLTNTGNVDLTGISVVDDNAGTASCPDTTLAVGTSMTCTASHAFTQAELDAKGSPTAGSGVLHNDVTAHSAEAPDAHDSLDIPISGNPAMTVSKSSSTSSLSAPQTVSYDYLVGNIGTVTLTGISLVDDNAGTVTCPATTLAVGTSMTCHATHDFTQTELDANGSPNAGSGLLANTVTAHSDETPDARALLDIPIVRNAAMTLAKSSPTSNLAAPQTVGYDYLVKNSGNVDLTAISLVDDNAGTVTCPATTLAVGTSMTCHAAHDFTQAELDANGSPTAGSGVLHNTVTATSAEAPDVHDSLDIPINGTTAMTVRKSSTTTSLSRPQTVTYDYLVTNTGNKTLNNVNLVDDNADTVTCPTNKLDVGASMTCTATHEFTQAELDAYGSPTPGSGVLANTVTATAVPQTPTVQDSLDIPIVRNAALTVAKSSTTTSLSSAPQTVGYDYLLTNTGNVDLTGISLVDDNAGAVSCPDTTLAVGTSMICHATHRFTQSELDANGSPNAGSGQLANIVTAHSNEAPDARDLLDIPITQDPAMTVAKSSTTTSLSSAPQTVGYDYLLTNTGDVDLTGISLVDDNAGAVTCPDTTLAVGTSMICHATHLFTQAELDADGSPTAGSGLLENTVTATSTQAPDEQASLQIPILRNAAMTVGKSSSTTRLSSAPQTVTYDYLVTDTGNVTLTGISLVDDNAGTVTCPATSLDPSTSMTCHATHGFTQAELDANGSPTAGSGLLANTVTAHSDQTPDARDLLDIPIVRNAALTVEKSSSTTVLAAPQTVDYDYLVTNTGNVDLTGINLVDDNAGTVTCPATTLAVGGSMTCSASHEFTQAELDAEGSPTAGSGVLHNTVTAHSSEGPDAHASLDIPISGNPAMTVAKSSTTASLSSAPQTVGYDYLVTNIGTVTLTGISLVDDNAGAVTCPATTLAVGTSMTCTASHVFTQAELNQNGSPTAGSRVLHNTVTAHSDQTADTQASLDIPIVRNATLTVTKSSTSTSLSSAPQRVGYDYLVTNTGNVDLTGISLVDDNAGTVTCPNTTLAVGTSMACTATHVFTQAELDANGSPTAGSGLLANTVTAHSNEVQPAGDSLAIPIIQNTAMTVVKSSPTATLSTPQAVAYDYLVTNTGNVTLTGINLADDNAGAVTCPNTTLGVGASMTCTASHLFTQTELNQNGSPTPGSRVLHNNVTAHSSQAPDAHDSLDIPIARNAALTVAKSSTTTTLSSAPQTVGYDYLVTNTGNVDLTGISLVDDNAGAISCPATTLTIGASMGCTGSHTFTQTELDTNGSPNAGSGRLANTVTAHSNETPPTTDSLAIPIVRNTSMTVVKSSPTANLSVPQAVGYDYLVTNTGNVDLTGISLVDDNAGTVTCPATTLAVGGSMTCSASHEFTQAELDANGSPTAGSGGLANTVTAHSDQTPDAHDSLDIPIVQNAAMKVVKSSTTTLLSAPQTVGYDYLVTNTGNVDLTGIDLVDDNAAVDPSCPTTLAVGASMTCHATHVFTQTELDANGSPTAGSAVLRNTVTATSNEAPGAQDSLDIPIVRTASMTVAKSSPTTTLASAPQTVSYDYLVTNTGTVTLTGINLVDDNADTVTCPATTLAVTASMTCTATHLFTQSELDANGSPTADSGLLQNIVTATSNEAPDARDSLDIPIVRDAALTVAKTSTTTSLSAPQTVTYDYLVTNTGNVTLTGINLVDDNAGAVTCPATTLSVGTSMTCRATHVFTQAELDANGSPTADSRLLHNTVTATSNEAPDAHDSLDIPIVRNAAMTVKKSSTTTLLSAPQTVDYDYLVTNTGNVTLTGISLIDDNAGTVSCPATSLDPSASMTCHATHDFTQTELNANGSPTVGSGVLHNNVTAHSAEAPDAHDSLDIPISGNPAMTIKKSSLTSSLSVPQTVNYDYLVKNIGNLTLTGINLADDNAGTVTCPATTLAVGASMTCTATHVFTQAELDANGSPTAESGLLANTVTAASDQTPDAQDSLEIPIVRDAALTVAKSSTTSSLSGPQAVDYDYVVKNTGNVDLTAITLLDDNAGAVTCPDTTLQVGASMTCHASHLFTQTELDANGSPTPGSGQLVNTVTASSDQAPPEKDSLQIPIVQRLALTLQKVGVLDTTVVAPADRADAGDKIDYTLTATNTSNVTLNGIVISDPSIVVACTPTQPTALTPGEELVCKGSHTLTQADVDGGEVTNTALAAGSSPSGKPITDTDTTTVQIPPDPSLTLRKSAVESSYSSVGDVLHYRYVVTNTGAVRLLGPVTVSDNKASVTCPAVTTVANDDGFLDPGESLTCTATYVVTQADLNAGAEINTATATAAGISSDPVAVTVPAVQVRALSLAKSASPTTFGGAGEVITYRYIAKNIGNVTLAGPITVTDNRTTVTCPAGSLAPGASTTCTASYTITQADVAAGAVTNLATAAANGTSSNPAQARVTLTTQPTPEPPNPTPTPPNPTPPPLTTALQVTKQPASQRVAVGGTATFTITVTNAGTATLTDLVVADPLSPRCSRTSATLPALASLPPGASIRYTCTRPKVQTSFTNVVTVSATGSNSVQARTNASASVGIFAPPLRPAPRPNVVISKGPPSQTVARNGTASFKITLANTGGAAATDVTVSDPRSSDCNHHIETLAAGKSTSYTCARTAVTAGFRNVARVTWKSPTGGHGGATSRVALVKVAPYVPPQEPAITIVKGPKQQTLIDGRAHFRISVRNTGNVKLHAVKVTDPRALSCTRTLGTLAPGHSRSYTCRGPAVSHGYTNTAEATAVSPSGTRIEAADTALVTVKPKPSRPQVLVG
jgi:uncharacterized repeat protein (TIGR01451 family)